MLNLSYQKLMRITFFKFSPKSNISIFAQKNTHNKNFSSHSLNFIRHTTVIFEPQQYRKPKTQMAAVKHSIREFTPYVINDHGYGLSFILAFVDMVSTVLRMSGMTGLHLSPQVLMDAHCDDVPSCVALATKKELGIQTIDTYPYIMAERPIEEWSETEYIAGESKRFRIDDVKYISDPDEIITVILANFGEGGRKFPFVGVLRTNDFKNCSVAAVAAAADGIPYHLPVTASRACNPRGLKTRHAVVIVGVDTTLEDPLMHHCEVKSSYGEQWGIGGFSRVGLEVFECVLVPVYGDLAVDT